MRPKTAPLFDAAHACAGACFSDTPTRIIIHTQSGQKVTYSVPPGWTPDSKTDRPDGGSDAGPDGKIPSPSCVVDVLVTLHEIGHRLTRMALCEALEDKGRRWSESVVGAVLTRLMQLGVLSNRQDVEPKGYGLPDS